MKNRTVDRTPSVLLIPPADHGRYAEAGDSSFITLNLDDFYNGGAGSSGAGGISEWVTKNAVPLVGK